MIDGKSLLLHDTLDTIVDTMFLRLLLRVPLVDWLENGMANDENVEQQSEGGLAVTTKA
jgi:hypothetical protein